MTELTDPKTPERPTVAFDRHQVADLADDLVEDIAVALQHFDTPTLRAIADYRDSICEDGWMQRLIREYVEVWR